MRALEKKQLFFIDACLRSDVVKSGAFDLTGLLAALEAKALEMGAKLIVFDAIDVLLSLLDDPAAECRELYRLHEWLMLRGLTGIITTKIEEGPAWPLAALRLHAVHGRLRGAAEPAADGSCGGALHARAQVPRLGPCAQ
jgi:KaiC/GvpD/RAD55 family RecA-like ATPase